MSTTGPQYDGWEGLSDIGPTTSDIGPTTTFHRTVTARMGVSVRNWYNQDVRLCPRLLCQQKTSCTLFSGQVGPYWRNWRDKLLARFFWAKAGIVYVLGLCPLLLCQQKTTCTPVPRWDLTGENVGHWVSQNSTNFWHNFLGQGERRLGSAVGVDDNSGADVRGRTSCQNYHVVGRSDRHSPSIWAAGGEGILMSGRGWTVKNVVHHHASETSCLINIVDLNLICKSPTHHHQNETFRNSQS